MSALKVDLSIRHWPQRSALTDGALAFCVALVLATGAIALAREPGSIASIWLANGAVIGIAVSAPASRRPGLLLLASLAYFIANLAYDTSVMNALAFAPGNLLDMVLGTWVLGRLTSLQRFMNDARAFFRLLAWGALLPPLLGAMAGAGFLHLVGHSDFSVTWGDWFIGSALGSVVMLPLVLALRARAFKEGLHLGSALALLLVVSAGSLVTFALVPYPFGLVSVVLLAVAYFQPRLVTFAAGPLVVLAFGVAVGQGWLLPATDDTPLGHGLMYLTLLLVVTPPQVVSIIVARQRALEDILTVVGGQANQLAAFIDMRGILQWANEARQAYWGVPNEQSVGKSWLDNLPVEHRSGLLRAMLFEALAGQVVQRVMEVNFPARGLRTVALHLQPAYDEERHQLGVLFTSTDVTDIESSRRQLEALTTSLEVTNQDLQQFVRVSSHDLREPLNTIVQFSSLIEERDGAVLSVDSKDYFRHVRSAASRMSTMLEDIRLYVQVDELDPAAFQAVDLDELVDSALATLDERIQALGGRVQVEAMGSAWGDPGQLRLAVTNLLGNALKFVPPDRAPCVQVSARRQGQQLELCFADNGIGIDPDKLSLLGQPFRRLHSRRVYEGTGLGLATCRRIARRHGGDLHIASTPGSGSHFCLSLPLPAAL